MEDATQSVIEKPPHVLMVAAECRDLAKVGGLADVVRDLSQALRTLDVPVRIVMPYYDVVRRSAQSTGELRVDFGGKSWPLETFECELESVPLHLLRSTNFFGGAYGNVYIDSDRLGRGPFEDDAKRFAFFSAAVLAFVESQSRHHPIEALHCHDWHTGVLLVLLKHDPRYRQLASTLRTLFTIHNLDYQGTRPFEMAGDRELLSFADWFPALYQGLAAEGNLEALRDPRAADLCFNPMRAGIVLADNVNTVSPTYAQEITQPDDPARNFVGGRGLEHDLARLSTRGGLHGILNGLDYRLNDPTSLTPPFNTHVEGWQAARRQHKVELLADLPGHMRRLDLKLGGRFWNRERVLANLSTYRPDEWIARPLIVAVTRAVSQKVSILLEALEGGASLLQEMLKRSISLLLLGTGDLQDQLEEINHCPNGLFVCAFDPEFAGQLYAGGDLFLMPSDFEPCGISQMIAMRYGCLPLVHDIGGLHDTVQDMQTGFVYAGTDRNAAKLALLETLDRALDHYANHRTQWTAMQKAAMQARFEWTTSARKYVELYRGQ